MRTPAQRAAWLGSKFMGGATKQVRERLVASIRDQIEKAIEDERTRCEMVVGEVEAARRIRESVNH